MTKAQLRVQAIARRASCRPEWGERLTDHLIHTAFIPQHATVGGFWPLDGEIDIRPLLLALVARRHAVLLPETPPIGLPLIFRHWHPGAGMIPERFGTLRPDGPVGTPTVLLVPLLAFDWQCRRLGYGGGYYDRTIPTLPGIRTIGCAFAAQQVDEVPVLPHDAPLDAVATETGILYKPEG